MNKKVILKIQILILMSVLLTLQSCIGKSETKVSISRKTKQKEYFPSSLVSVNIANNLMTINGTGFSPATVVTIKKDGVEIPLTINSKSNTQLVTSSIANLSLLLNSAFDLIIGTAEAQAVYSLTFTLDNNSIALTKLSNTGASPGQVIKYNGTNWAAAALNEPQNYQGTWNATTNVPDLTIPSSTPGDYFIVATAGTYNAITYAVGDWIISDGATWQKVPIANTLVTSFQGRTGIVTLLPADYVSLKDGVTQKITGSKLIDIADIDISTPQTNGQVLKWNNGTSKWVPGDITSGGAAITLGDLSATSPLSYNNTTGVFSLPTANILALPLTGLASGTGAIAATDTILAAFGKLMSVPSDYVSKASGNTLTGATVVAGIGASLSVPTPLITDYGFAANVQYVNDQIAANGNWSKGAASSINYTAGSVGVGIAAPTTKLHVDVTDATVYSSGLMGQSPSDVLLLANEDQTTTGYTGLMFQHKSSGVALGRIALFGSFFDTDIAALTFGLRGMSGGGGAIERMRITAHGNVGIGTTVPNGILSVQPQQYATGTASQTTTTVTGSGTFTFSMVGSQLVFANGVSAGTITAFIDASNLTVSTSQTVLTQAYSIKYTGFNITTAGLVGIGTTTPTAKLEVVNSTLAAAGTRMLIRDTSNGPGTLYGQKIDLDTSYSNQYGLDIDVNGGVPSAGTLGVGLKVNVSGATTNYAALLTGGNVGIGTTTPVGALDVRGGTATAGNGTAITLVAQNAAAFGNGGNVAITAGSASTTGNSNGGNIILTPGAGNLLGTGGHVGIGIAVPTGFLDVQGGTSITGASGSGINLIAQTGAPFTAGGDVNIAGGSAGTGNSGNGGSVIITAGTSSTGGAYRGGNIVLIPGTATGTAAVGNVGIGTTTPSTKLHIAHNTGSILTLERTGTRVWGVDLSSGNFNITDHGADGLSSSTHMTVKASGEVGIGNANPTYKLSVENPSGNLLSLTRTTSNAFNFTIGDPGNGITNRSLSIAAATNAADIAFITDMTSAANMIIKNSGNVGIGTTSPGFTLDVNGSIAAVGALQAHSDKRLKKNIVTIDHPLEKLLSLKGVFFDWRKDEFPEIHFEGGRQMGVIAQDVEKVFPEAVTKNEKGIRSVAYTMLIAPIIETIKEFNKYLLTLFSTTKEHGGQIALMQTRMKILEAENTEMKRRLNKLEKVIMNSQTGNKL